MEVLQIRLGRNKYAITNVVFCCFGDYFSLSSQFYTFVEMATLYEMA